MLLGFHLLNHFTIEWLPTIYLFNTQTYACLKSADIISSFPLYTLHLLSGGWFSWLYNDDTQMQFSTILLT